jgi:hypothetical protein
MAEAHSIPQMASGAELEAAIEALRASLRGEVFCPDDAGYDEARLIWNGMFDKKPALIAMQRHRRCHRRREFRAR